MMDQEKNEILNSYKWIKVKRYNDDDALFWEDRFNSFGDNNIEEITFFINKIREIVSSIK